MTGLSDTHVALVIASVLGGMIIPQAALTVWFTRMLRRGCRNGAIPPDGRARAAAVPTEVVLCLRGCDATLGDVLAALARQDHADWRLRVVVDSENDPAWNVAHATVGSLAERWATWRQACIEPLAARPTAGSLKCASLRQAFASLDPRTRVVALIDADSVVRHDWLVTLVHEVMRPGVGAVSGNRWYDPTRDSVPGTVRLVWNAGAIVQMSAFGIPWGGSLAIRREAMDACAWPDVIRTTLCEDTALADPLARSGWKYRFVPGLIAVDNDDDVALGPLTRWIARQLLTARLHHRSWPLVALHGLGTSALLLIAMVFAAMAVVRGSWVAFSVTAGVVAVYEAAAGVLFLTIAVTMRGAVEGHGGSLRPSSLRRLLWQTAMIPLTQAVYAVATIAAITTRAIEWRGIVYDVTWLEGRRGVLVRRVAPAPSQDTARAADGPVG